jgi:uncharacterized 2Fe-2S/4Fe-4S cluster protein (DUF4445 family)
MKDSKKTYSEPPLVKVTVKHGPRETVITASAGGRLVDVLREQGIILFSVCGGRGICKKCLVSVEKQGLVLACKYMLEHDIDVTIPLPAAGGTRILESDGGAVKKVDGDNGVTIASVGARVTVCFNGRIIAEYENASGKTPVPYGAAIDIGTTTVVVYLEDLAAVRTVAIESFVNPQAFAGSDVVSRIHFVMEHETGLAQLQQSIVASLNRAIEKACAAAAGKIVPREIYKLTAAGNPAMLHLLLAVDPSPIARAPYVPVFTEAKTRNAAELGLAASPGAVVTTLPSVSGYVGADVVAGIASTPMTEAEAFSLYIDIGTNGEMALGNRDSIFCCSSAAGPAFEGARISCGVGGVEGAICSYENGVYSTIGGHPPVGICGSGIVDIVAWFLDRGIIGAGGFMESDVCIERRGNTATGRDIILTPVDVREVQLAKAAIASGIKILMKEADVEISKIEKVYLAGAFGNFMNVANAARIGMIPPDLAPKVVCIGNAAGTGARLALRSRGFERSLKKIVDISKYIELSGRSDFNETFVEEMGF